MLRLVNYTIDEICAEVSSGRRTLICYGAGGAFKNFLKMFGSTYLEGKIAAVVDQRAVRSGGAEVSENGIVIHTLAEILATEHGSLLILVTCQYLQEIYAALKAEPALAGQTNHTVAFYGFVVDQYYRQRIMSEPCSLPRREPGVSIPKVIHYCWFGRNPLPERYVRWMESWKKCCPDYEIVEWNEDNYDIHANRYMSEAYEAGKWGFVPDYARLDIIYRYGGVYLDTDVELVRSLDDLLQESAFAGFQDHCVAFGLGFGAVPHHEGIRILRDAYDGVRFRRPDGSLNLLPSPAYQTDCLLEHGLLANGERQNVLGIELYPCDWFSPMLHYSHRLVMNENTHSIHPFDGSWVAAREKSEWGSYPELFDRIEYVHE